MSTRLDLRLRESLATNFKTWYCSPAATHQSGHRERQAKRAGSPCRCLVGEGHTGNSNRKSGFSTALSSAVTTEATVANISHLMAANYSDRRRGVVSIDQFEERFRQTFGREMTPDERRFLRLTMQMMEGDEDEASEAAAGTAS